MLWNVKNRRVSVRGSSMCYASFGKGSRNLIILPGLSDGLATVAGKALLLAAPYRTFFQDYTIYMFSRKESMPLKGYSIRDMAFDQAMALRKLGLDKVSVLGVSEGGMIAQYLAVDYPGLVKKLVLAVTAPQVNDTIRNCVLKWIEMAERGDHRSLMIDTAERSYSDNYLKKYRKAYPFLGCIGRPRNYDRFLVNARAILDFNAVDELSSIACPTLILGGEADRIVGADASRELAEHISGSELFLYPNLGHAAYEEANDFNRRVLEFLNSEKG